MEPRRGNGSLEAAFEALARERTAATDVKQNQPILVVLGNPPYNAFAGTSPASEGGLVEPYKQGLQDRWGVRKFNLDDLYIRFFRVAERRVAERTGQGIVCFISNYSWLSYGSFVVMRSICYREFDSMDREHERRPPSETGKRAHRGDSIRPERDFGGNPKATGSSLHHALCTDREGRAGRLPSRYTNLRGRTGGNNWWSYDRRSRF